MQFSDVFRHFGVDFSRRSSAVVMLETDAIHSMQEKSFDINVLMQTN